MSDLLSRLPAFRRDGLVNVVIDTPSGSCAKFKYDAKGRCYRLGRLLPAGMSFPYNFGSIPRTRAEDGDPLDLLVLNTAAFLVGCLVHAGLWVCSLPSRRNRERPSATIGCSGRRGESGDAPGYIQIASAWLVVNVGSGTPDKPSVTLSVPTDPDAISSL